ncbi:hypothetical protein VRZ08_24555 [Rhodopseudomonas sp. G2_2311]|uniref:hypothetical protein n=1 Tax=Rhodopseudomonas sp. G2_2311 TaxID=3114287 RepID=UPI0039C6758E
MKLKEIVVHTTYKFDDEEGAKRESRLSAFLSKNWKQLVAAAFSFVKWKWPTGS